MKGENKMNMTDETIKKIKATIEPAFKRIGVADATKNVELAVKFARSQPIVDITLDNQKTSAVAVDIATVFSLEGDYRTVIDDDGKSHTVETIQALSVVVAGEDVKLCKSKYDVVNNGSFEDAKFVNAKYWTTSVDQLTEEYIC